MRLQLIMVTLWESQQNWCYGIKRKRCTPTRPLRLRRATPFAPLATTRCLATPTSSSITSSSSSSSSSSGNNNSKNNNNNNSNSSSSSCENREGRVTAVVTAAGTAAMAKLRWRFFFQLCLFPPSFHQQYHWFVDVGMRIVEFLKSVVYI